MGNHTERWAASNSLFDNAHACPSHWQAPRTKGKREREGDEGRVKHNFASYCLIRVGSFVGPGEVDGAATSSLKVPVHIYLSLAAETDGTLKER